MGMISLLNAVVGSSLRNRALVFMGVVLLVLTGVYAAQQLPIDAVPDVTTVQVQVITSSPALSPVEVEQYVTVPIERAMAGIPYVIEVRSLSKYGISVVTVVFTDATDIRTARQFVGERLREAQDTIPSHYGRPMMGPISSGLGEIFQFVVQSKRHTLMELEEILTWSIAPQLRMVPGVVEVNVFGGESRQYQVLIDPHRLQAAGLSITNVAQALEKTNANAGGGYIERNGEQLIIGTQGLVRSLDDLKSVVIAATPQGIPITVAHVADVRFGPQLRRGAASMDGQGEVVVGVAMMLTGENARTVTAAVKKRIADLGPSLPEGVHVDAFYDRGALVNRTIRTVVTNLAEGALLVIGILMLLLGDLRAGLIVASVIPLSMLFALLMMKTFGVTGNLMSLGAIDFGLIVDAAVIIVEHAVSRLSEVRQRLGRELTVQERSDTVWHATSEVRGASMMGEAIIAVVYIPILALRGVEGKLFHPMVLTVLFALAGAMVLSVTAVPVFAALFLKPHAEVKTTWLMRRAQQVYDALLHRVMDHRRITVGAVAGLLLIAILGVMSIGAEFMPALDEGDLLVEARRLPGIALTESIATDQRMQQALRTIPEITHVVSKTGAPVLAVDPMGIEQTDAYIQLADRSKWRHGLTRAALGEEIIAVLARAVPEVSAAMSQPIQMRTNELIAGIRSDVAVEIYGPDLDTLQNIATDVSKAIAGIPGVVDLRVEQGAGLGYLRIAPDRAKLARYGLTVDDVNMLAESTGVGRQTGIIFEGDRRFPLVVKFADLAATLEDFRALPLKSATGYMVPLGDVADITLEKGPAVVNRSQQSRRRLVEFNVRGRDMLSVVRDAQSAVEQHIQWPTGYRVAWGGEYNNFISARHRLMLAVPVVIVLIVFLLWLSFDALTPALVILLNIPFAVVGGVFALWLRGLPLSISAGVGFIALLGVAILNGLVLISASHQREALGESPAIAILHAARSRLRPVLMTALVATLGFVPMALSTAPGSEVQRPLATVVIGGILSATVLTLVVLPMVYSFVLSRRVQHLRSQ